MKREAQSSPEQDSTGVDEHFFMLQTPRGAIPEDAIKLLFVLFKDGQARWLEATTIGVATLESKLEARRESSPKSSDSSQEEWLKGGIGDQVDVDGIEWIWNHELGCYMTSSAHAALMEQRRGSSDEM